jgi:hypothetical protein
MRTFQTKVVERIQTHILCSKIIPRKLCHLRDNAEKYGTTGQATYGDIKWRKSLHAGQLWI